MKTPERIIDANGNRAREALRVLEEAARFIVEDPATAGELKRLRHGLSQALAALPALIHHRDTPSDVGTTLTTPSESRRDGLGDVVTAAGARLSEALRVIEEYAKALQNPPAARLAVCAEQTRYLGYDLTQRLSRAVGSGKARQWRVCLLLTESLCTPMSWREVLGLSLDHGVDVVQVREKMMESAALLTRVQEVITLVDRRAQVIVNDRPDIALIAGADGVHLGQSDLDPMQVRRLAGNALIIGVSTANLDQARRARDRGADYCGVGPMFPTTTKHKPDIAGPSYLREYLAWNGLPHLAIGGVTPQTIDQLVHAGCRGVAVSSAICSAKDPGAATAALHRALAPQAEPGRFY